MFIHPNFFAHEIKLIWVKYLDDASNKESYLKRREELRAEIKRFPSKRGK